MFYLVLMKAKVGASWCDLYYTYSSFFCSVNINFLKLGGIWKRKKKRHTQAFQFLQLVVHMYFVPVKLFILEIKEKKSILEKKLSGLSMWPRLDQVLSLASWWCQAIFFWLFCFLSLKDAWFWFYFDLYMSLTSLISFSFGGVGIL